MWWFTVPALATEVLATRVTEEMHWFTATALQVERIWCRVGIPVDGEGEPYVGCAFPAGRIEDPNVPRQLRRAAAGARRAVRAHNDDPGMGPVKDLRVTFVATERRAFLCDQALMPDGLWSTGEFLVGFHDDEAHAAADGGFAGGGHGGLIACTGRPVGFDASAFDRSVFLAAWEGDAQALGAQYALLAALPPLLREFPETPSEPARDGIAPSGLVIDPNTGRAIPGDSGFWMRVPDDRFLGVRVSYTLYGADGSRTPAGSSLVSGIPDDWTVFQGPDIPAGSTLKATLEIFATDEPTTPEWTPERQGFERIFTSSLLGPRF